MTTPLSADLVAALAAVDVHGRRATVCGRVVEAANPVELRGRLADALYDALHAGRADTGGRTGDGDLSAALATAVPHDRTRVHGIVRSTGEHGHVLELDGVRVAVPADAVSAAPARVSDHVAARIDCARPRLSPGFLVVDGSVGHGLADGPVLRLYAHLPTARVAVEVWRSTLELLEGARTPYRLKVCSHSRDYPRRDAMVAYLGPAGQPVVPALVTRLAGVGTEVSAYAHRLAPGVGMAWDPDDPRPWYAGLSFGEHRSRLLAEGLSAYADGEHRDRDTALAVALSSGNVDPGQPYRNITSTARAASRT